jgi:hypothetical protein
MKKNFNWLRAARHLCLFAIGFSLHSAANAATSPIVVNYTQSGIERSASSAVDSLGNVYVAGSIEGFFGVLKYDSQGALLWVYRNSAKGSNNSVAVDTTGNVYCAGTVVNSAGQSQWLTLKLSLQGVELWSRVLGNGRAQTVVNDGSGGIYVGGASTAPFTIARYLADGTLSWQRTIATGFNDSFDGLARDSAGNAIAIGRIVSTTVDSIDMVIVKLSSQGATQWQALYGQIGHMQFPRDLAIDAAGNTWVTGVAASTGDDGLVPPFTLQYSADGTVLRSMSQGGAAIALDSFGGILVSDTLEAATLQDRRPSITKFDTQGNKLWEIILTTSESQGSPLGSRLAVDDAANVYVASTIDTGSGNLDDNLISKLDTNGNIQWQHRFNGANAMQDTTTSLQADAFGNVFATGNSYVSCPSSPTGSCENIPTLIFTHGIDPVATSSLPSAPPINLPTAPGNLSASASHATVTLQWRDNANNESGFRIERCVGSTCTNFSQIAEVGANTVQFTNSGLSLNTAYVYRVRAFNAAGNSSYSNTASVKTPRK